MPLVQLIYASKSTGDLSVDEIKEIVNLASIKNKELNITGFLVANFQYFLQCLEGDRASVDELYRTISNDGRHKELSLLGLRDTEERVFSNWNMGVVTRVDLHKKLLALYNGSESFNPFAMNSEDALGLLHSLSQTRR